MGEITAHSAATRDASAEPAEVSIEDRRSPEPIDPTHAAIVERGMDQARLGQFASADAVEAVFRRADP